MKREFTLSWNSLFGFVLINNYTRVETPLSDAEAFRWSDKSNVSVSGSANKRIEEVIGFEIWDKAHGKVGILKGFNEQSAQSLFEIERHGLEILIPIPDEFIMNINRNKKIINVKTPPGLIELYIE